MFGATRMYAKNGEVMSVTYPEAKPARIKVYESWVMQGIGRNQDALDFLDVNYRTAIADLEARLQHLVDSGRDDPALRQQIAKMKTRLGYVQEGLKVLADPKTLGDDKYFTSSAILETAVDMGWELDDPRTAYQRWARSADQLKDHRDRVFFEFATDMTQAAYHMFLAQTMAQQMWTIMAYARNKVADAPARAGSSAGTSGRIPKASTSTATTRSRPWPTSAGSSR